MVTTRSNLQTPIKKQKELYSDFLTDFTVHPITQELSRAVNEQAVKRSIRNIVLTYKGERLFNPDLGSDITKLLFEPFSNQTAEAIRTAVVDAINSFEPRVRIVSVDVIPDEINDSYKVNIVFIILNIKEPANLVLILDRVR